MPFSNREEAGRLLARRLAREKIERPIVFALPRGGIPVGIEVAQALHAPLEILVVRKVGSPENPEYGLGAVTEGGFYRIDEDRAYLAGASVEDLQPTLETERREVERRVKAYRGGRPRASSRDRTAVVVDDGLATGGTARVACDFLRQEGARRVILAVPVCAPDTATALEADVDRVICLERPDFFFAVGQFYGDFHSITDAEVVELLGRAYAREKPRAA